MKLLLQVSALGFSVMTGVCLCMPFATWLMVPESPFWRVIHSLWGTNLLGVVCLMASGLCIAGGERL